MQYTIVRTNQFNKWINSLRDKRAFLRINQHITNIENTGNWGNYKPIKNHADLYELRFYISPGYRVYFGVINKLLIVLLRGGTKGTQQSDIVRAGKDWHKYREDDDAPEQTQDRAL